MTPARKVARSIASHPSVQNVLLVLCIAAFLMTLYATIRTAQLPGEMCHATNDQSARIVRLVGRSVGQPYSKLRTPGEQRRAERFLAETRRELSPIDCGGGWLP